MLRLLQHLIFNANLGHMVYRAVQPITDIKPDGVSYQEYTSADELRNHVYCYWELMSAHVLDQAYTYVTVADGCVDILIDMSTEIPSGYLIGPTAEHSLYELYHPFHYRGIRFLPGAFTAAFTIPADELKDQFIPLEQILPSLQKAMYTIFSEGATLNWTDAMDQVLLPMISHSTIDPRVQSIMTKMIESESSEASSSSIYLSPRQIQRIFKEHIGLPAKTLSRIIRLQQWLHSSPQKETPHYYDLGYYDQAHFIKECKKLSGYSPKEWKR